MPEVVTDDTTMANYVITVHLLPQKATLGQWIYVAQCFGHTQERTILSSADDAVNLVKMGLAGSKVIVWNPKAYKDDIEAWMKKRVVDYELKEFPLITEKIEPDPGGGMRNVIHWPTLTIAAKEAMEALGL